MYNPSTFALAPLHRAIHEQRALLREAAEPCSSTSDAAEGIADSDTRVYNAHGATPDHTGHRQLSALRAGPPHGGPIYDEDEA